MEEIILQAKYPIDGRTEYIEISISSPKIDTESPNADYFCSCKISGPNFEKNFDVFGIDPLQSTWIALRQIRVEIENFEKKTNMHCAYHYFSKF